MPSLDRLAAARDVTGYQHLELDARHHTATLKLPGMQLDLGGIAKGYAADEALKTLRAHGITRALVAVAGDMTAGDAPPGKAGWRVEVPSLDVPGAPPAQFVLLANAALSTSGDLFQRLNSAANATRTSSTRALAGQSPTTASLRSSPATAPPPTASPPP